jgi:hypothetical protein
MSDDTCPPPSVSLALPFLVLSHLSFGLSFQSKDILNILSLLSLLLLSYLFLLTLAFLSRSLLFIIRRMLSVPPFLYLPPLIRPLLPCYTFVVSLYDCSSFFILLTAINWSRSCDHLLSSPHIVSVARIFVMLFNTRLGLPALDLRSCHTLLQLRSRFALLRLLDQ